MNIYKSNLRHNVKLIHKISRQTLEQTAKMIGEGIHHTTLAQFLNNELIDTCGAGDSRYKKYKTFVKELYPFIDPESDLLAEILTPHNIEEVYNHTREEV